jgi:hypothetical protein
MLPARWICVCARSACQECQGRTGTGRQAIWVLLPIGTWTLGPLLLLLLLLRQHGLCQFRHQQPPPQQQCRRRSMHQQQQGLLAGVSLAAGVEGTVLP